MIQLLQRAHAAVPPGVKPAVDTAAILGGLTSLFGVLTGLFGLIGSVASAAWLVIRVYETKTVQSWLAKRRG